VLWLSVHAICSCNWLQVWSPFSSEPFMYHSFPSPCRQQSRLSQTPCSYGLSTLKGKQALYRDRAAKPTKLYGLIKVHHFLTWPFRKFWLTQAKHNCFLVYLTISMFPRLKIIHLFGFLVILNNTYGERIRSLYKEQSLPWGVLNLVLLLFCTLASASCHAGRRMWWWSPTR
jgi:hypothetical protein